MMATTHALIALVAAAPLAMLFPEHATSIAVTALAGGIFPDLDVMVGTHRKTLHFPVLGWLVVGGVGAAYMLSPHVSLLLAFTFALGATLHATTEPLGGGLEREPWKQTTDRSVYVHATRTWLAPRHVVPYDGSPTDLALTVCLAPTILLYENAQTLYLLVGAGVVVAIGYSVVRKSLPAFEDWLYEHVPLIHPFLRGLHGGDEGR